MRPRTSIDNPGPRRKMLRPSARQTISALRQPLAYALVGVANTAIGMTVIFVLMALGVPPVPSNAAGYALGLLTSFHLNSRITFRVATSRGNLVRFLVVAAVAYAGNLLVVIAVLRLTASPHLAQIAGIPVYLAIGFLANKYWAMAR
ncbi:GtrA family protein [Burkholderia multivorans]